MMMWWAKFLQYLCVPFHVCWGQSFLTATPWMEYRGSALLLGPSFWLPGKSNHLFSLFYPSLLVHSSQNRSYKVSLEYLHDCFSYFPQRTCPAYSSLTKRVLAEEIRENSTSEILQVQFQATITKSLYTKKKKSNSHNVFGFPLNIKVMFTVYYCLLAALVAQMVKNLPAKQKTWVRSLGWEDCPGGGHGNPLQDSCLENPHGQRSAAGSSVAY